MHTKKYQNSNFHISLTTDCDYFFRAVDDLFDFEEATQPSANSFSLSIDIREVKAEGPEAYGKYFYEHHFENPDILSGRIGHTLGHILSNPREKTITGTVSSLFKPEEFSHERLLDIALFQPMRYILSHHGYYFLHGAVVYNREGGILLTGPQNCGKSTLAIALLSHGFNYSNDDKVFLRNNKTDVELIPLPTKVGIGNPNVPVWKTFLKESALSSYGNKNRFSARDLNTGTMPKHAPVQAIVFPSYEKETPGEKVTVISKDEALRRLLQENFDLPDKQLFTKVTADQMLLFSKLISRAKAIVVTYNDENIERAASSLADTLNAPSA